MGFTQGKLNFRTFMVVGANKITLSEIHNALSSFAFATDSVGKEINQGWVDLGSLESTVDTSTRGFDYQNNIAFGFRIDTRKVPTGLVKQYCGERERKWLNDNPKMNSVPRMVKSDMKEAIDNELLVKALPSPAQYDVVWNHESETLLLCTTSTKVIDQFELFFCKSFEGQRLVYQPPFVRARNALTNDDDLERLEELNVAGSSEVIKLMQDNAWLGESFLLWLLYRTATTTGEYDTDEETFVTFIDNKIALKSNDENDKSKIVVTGEQTQFAEVKTALLANKTITEATINIEHRAQSWQFSLDAMTFDIKGLKLPSVLVDKDQKEGDEGLFYGRLHLIEVLDQLISALLIQFIHLRISDLWQSQVMKECADWVNGKYAELDEDEQAAA